MELLRVWCVVLGAPALLCFCCCRRPQVTQPLFTLPTPPAPLFFTPLSPVSPAPADALKPARGVVLQYPGGDGDWCPYIPGTSVRKNRTFSIELLCAPTQGTAAQFALSNVVEANVCDYRVQLKSLAGCPTTCITGSTMCSGNGICGYNTDSKRNQCFCNAGASGPQCASAPKASSGLSTEGVILIIVCIMLAGVLGLVGYMFMRLRKLTVDPSAYGELQGKCEWRRRQRALGVCGGRVGGRALTTPRRLPLLRCDLASRTPTRSTRPRSHTL